MKKMIYACFLLAYLLVCCTVTSVWVEQQMTLTGRVMTYKLGREGFTYAQIPLWMAWRTGGQYHLFSVETETGDDEVTRDVVREISDKDFSVNETEGYLQFPIVKECRILNAASRFPTAGEYVTVLDEKLSKRQVLVFTPDRSTIGNPTGGNFEIRAYSDNARLLLVTTRSPMMEREQLHILYPAENRWAALRAMDLADMRMFLENLPHVFAAILLMIVGFFWALWAWLRDRRALLALPLLIPGTVWFLLRNCTLPSSMLPARCIVDFAHYRTTSTLLRQTHLSSLIKVLLRLPIQQAKTRCVVIAAAAVFLLVLPLLATIFCTCRHRKTT